MTSLLTDQASASDVSDRAERKRVLNVLAQRRYRQRQKQKLDQVRSGHSVAKQPSLGNGSATSIASAASSTPEEHAGRSASSTSLDAESSSTRTNILAPRLSPLCPRSMTFDEVFLSSPSRDSGVDLLEANDPPDSVDDSAFDVIGVEAPFLQFDFPDFDMTSWLQTDETTTTTFPDARFEVPLLNLLNAAQILATHLHSLDRLFDLTSLSIFNTSAPDTTSWTLSLPQNLQPVPAQLAIPHHPLLDLLPWPAVRTKLICMFSVPAVAAPRDAEDGTVLDFQRFVHDVDDGGLFVAGAEPASTEAWEIGDEAFLKRWWWAFDVDVVRASNVKRRGRGVPLLRYGGAV